MDEDTNFCSLLYQQEIVNCMEIEERTCHSNYRVFDFFSSHACLTFLISKLQCS